MSTILVTGAAGFIGSNFVRHWRLTHPDDRIVAVDLLTYAGNRPNLADVEDGDRVVFLEADIGDGPAMVAALDDHDVDVDRQLRRRVAQQPRDPRSGPVHAHQRARHPGAAATRPAGSASPASTTCPPARSTATSPSTTRTPSPRTRRTGPGRRTTRRRPPPTTSSGRTTRPSTCPITITNCSNNYGPFQFPEKVIPLFTTRALERRGPAALRVDRQPARVAPRRRPLPGDRPRARPPAGSARRTTSAAAWRRASSRSPTSCSTGSASRRA